MDGDEDWHHPKRSASNSSRFVRIAQELDAPSGGLVLGYYDEFEPRYKIVILDAQGNTMDERHEDVFGYQDERALASPQLVREECARDVSDTVEKSGLEDGGIHPWNAGEDVEPDIDERQEWEDLPWGSDEDPATPIEDFSDFYGDDMGVDASNSTNNFNRSAQRSLPHGNKVENHGEHCPSDGMDYHGRCLGGCSECGKHLLSTGRYTPYCPSCDTCPSCGCPNADGFSHYQGCKGDEEGCDEKHDGQEGDSQETIDAINRIRQMLDEEDDGDPDRSRDWSPIQMLTDELDKGRSASNSSRFVKVAYNDEFQGMEESLKEKLYRVHQEVGDFIYDDTGMSARNFGDQFPKEKLDKLWNFYDLFPRYVQKWLSGRMSMQELTDITPDDIESEIDDADAIVQSLKSQACGLHGGENCEMEAAASNSSRFVRLSQSDGPDLYFGKRFDKIYYDEETPFYNGGDSDPEAPNEYLTGKDYPHVCEQCQKVIDDMAHEISMTEGEGPDVDFDPEAPMMAAYDRGLLCGGHQGCLERQRREDELKDDLLGSHEEWMNEMEGRDPFPPEDPKSLGELKDDLMSKDPSHHQSIESIEVQDPIPDNPNYFLKGGPLDSLASYQSARNVRMAKGDKCKMCGGEKKNLTPGTSICEVCCKKSTVDETCEEIEAITNATSSILPISKSIRSIHHVR